MILEIQHETRLEYSEPVIESTTEVHMQPVSDTHQSCRSFHLAVSPPTEIFLYQDEFGNRVHHFNLLAAHDQVRMLAASIVETHPRSRALSASRAVYPPSLDGVALDVFDFLKLHGPIRPTPRLTPLLETLRPRPGMSQAELVAQVVRYIQTHFEYAKAVTNASSPIDDVLARGKGVCQDFAHLMIAVLRSFSIPARYVSGYIHRPNQESQSHAWCEVWFPDLSWYGFDPTNDRPITDHYVKVAFGRDFSDVPPNKGTYRGRAWESIFVRVETRALDQLPSLSWQEQLPPLNVPLTAIVPRARGVASSAEDEAQQQQ